MGLERPKSTEQALLQEAFAFGRSLNSKLAFRERAGLDRESWHSCGQFGLFGLPIPERYGGTSESAETIAEVLMALGRGCRDNGLLFSLNAHLWAFQMPLLRFGSEAQRERYLVPAVKGELIGSHAITEPSSGSDALSMRTQAKRQGDGWVLNGTKTFVTNAPIADALLVFATVNPSLKAAGVTAFILDRETEGLTLSKPIPKCGLRSSPMGEVVLSDCRAADEQRLGAVGAGTAVFQHAMEWERTFIFASHLGAMERLLDECVEYAKSRVQFGAPIAQHPEIANKLVDMRVAVEVGRLLLLKAARERDSGGNPALFSAIAKLVVSEAHVRQALDAIQLHGAYGIAEEQGIERELRDALPGTLYSGTTEMQRKIIARWMGLS